MSAAPAPAPRSRFAAVVAQQESEVDLALAALLIAAEEYPQLVPEPYLRRIDILAERVRDRLGEETAPLVILQELNRVLFEEEGFRGNAEAYYDPRNSFLNDVLDRRAGVPLTLSLLYLEIGWRLGLPLHGVNFPGHFLVRYDGEALKLLIDPFQRGEIRFEDEAQELLDRVYGGTVTLQPSYLRPADRKDILVRLLSNLKGIYLNTRDDRRALAATERILLVRPDAAEEVRDRGMLLARLGFADDAVQELRDYLARAPGADDAERVRLLIRELGGSDPEQI
ncbi:MAG: tetratricopeptide repeat protein [Candidatus Cloacimonetes bacterium]|jgi:regulator of sirC expression with transglutaminase-like and TPR domain|nr:tetratricopeptide repeat protein [Candidatus Cloacimonadota bacterium]